ncbi:MAG: hypothetical protein AB7I50_10710 [Vicinamibacterales bacterium]
MPPSPPADRPQSGHSGAAARIDAARAALVVETRRGGAGRSALEHYADRLDAALRAVYAVAGPPRTTPLALVALGPYGRRQPCLYDHVDLLVLFGRTRDHDDERFLDGFMGGVHELALPLVTRVRTLAEFESPDCANPETLLLLDGRLIQGDGMLLDQITSLLQTPEMQQRLVDTVRRRVFERHSRFDDTVYQLEPDVAQAPGGLEDVLAARHIARLRQDLDLGQGPIVPGALETAEEFLLRVRSILHGYQGRDRSVLTHDLQEEVAHELGTKGVRTQQRVERLMGEYFKHARTVARVLLWACHRSGPVPSVVARMLADNVRLGQEGIDFIDADRGALEPTMWLSLFALSLEQDAPVSDGTLATIRQHAEHYEPGRFYLMPEDRRRLLQLLRPRAGLYALLSQLHDSEMLGCMFPEFRAITGRMLRDFHHKYTVDEHSLLAIREVERLARGESFDPRQERFETVLREVAVPELLVLSLLLHDTGKWREGNHLLESVRLTKAALSRLDLDAASRGSVEFLVAHQEDMATIAFRRDSEDPQVIERFAALVGNVDRLKMLCLFTYADMAAVSPQTLTPWKEDLLWRLYVETHNELTLGAADDVIGRNTTEIDDLLATRPDGLSQDAVVDFVEGMPRRYLHVFDAATIYEHIRLGREINPDDVHLSLTPRNGVWELTVVTLDKPFLFSHICGTLAGFGMDILRGNALTSVKGLVADSFQFADPSAFLSDHPDHRQELCSAVADIISGRSVVEELTPVTTPPPRRLRSISPNVRVDNYASTRHTILEIVAENRLGLLYRISRTISRHDCSVDLVLISTEGEKAVDVFHVSKHGEKLTDTAQRHLADALLQLLQADTEAS